MSAADKARFDTLGSLALTWRPGGVAGQGVVLTWADVETFANGAAVPWVLFYDNALGATEVPATSTLDFRQLVLIRGLVTNPAPLVVLDGGFIKNFSLGLSAVVQCEAITRSGVVFDIINAVVDLREGGRIENQAGVSLVPAIDVDVATMIFACLTAGSIFANEPSVPMVNYTVVGGFFIVAAVINTGGQLSNFPDNGLVADATSTLFSIFDTTSRLGAQANFLGAIFHQPIALSANMSWSNGDTASRPVALTIGQPYFDTDLGFTIWWNGTVWVNASGLPV